MLRRIHVITRQPVRRARYSWCSRCRRSIGVRDAAQLGLTARSTERKRKIISHPPGFRPGLPRRQPAPLRGGAMGRRIFVDGLPWSSAAPEVAATERMGQFHILTEGLNVKISRDLAGTDPGGRFPGSGISESDCRHPHPAANVRGDPLHRAVAAGRQVARSPLSDGPAYVQIVDSTASQGISASRPRHTVKRRAFDPRRASPPGPGPTRCEWRATCRDHDGRRRHLGFGQERVACTTWPRGTPGPAEPVLR